MEELHAEGVYDFKPDIGLYNSVLNGWAKQCRINRDAGKRAIALIDHLIEVRLFSPFYFFLDRLPRNSLFTLVEHCTTVF